MLILKNNTNIINTIFKIYLSFLPETPFLNPNLQTCYFFYVNLKTNNMLNIMLKNEFAMTHKHFNNGPNQNSPVANEACF